MFERTSETLEIKEFASRKLVRCTNCSGVMVADLFRCPDCGQITHGDEPEVNGRELAAQLREKAAKRKEKMNNTGECQDCGKGILKGNTCNVCAARHVRNSIFMIACAVAVITLMLLYLLRTP